MIRLGAHDDATKTVGEVARVAKGSARDFVRAASLQACCVPLAAKDDRLSEASRAERANTYGAQAVAFLREAFKHGYKDLDAIKNDRGFDALSSRADFREWLADLSASVPEVRIRASGGRQPPVFSGSGQGADAPRSPLRNSLSASAASAPVAKLKP